MSVSGRSAGSATTTLLVHAADLEPGRRRGPPDRPASGRRSRRSRRGCSRPRPRSARRPGSRRCAGRPRGPTRFGRDVDGRDRRSPTTLPPASVKSSSWTSSPSDRQRRPSGTGRSASPPSRPPSSQTGDDPDRDRGEDEHGRAQAGAEVVSRRALELDHVLLEVADDERTAPASTVISPRVGWTPTRRARSATSPPSGRRRSRRASRCRRAARRSGAVRSRSIRDEAPRVGRDPPERHRRRAIGRGDPARARRPSSRPSRRRGRGPRVVPSGSRACRPSGRRAARAPPSSIGPRRRSRSRQRGGEAYGDRVVVHAGSVACRR